MTARSTAERCKKISQGYAFFAYGALEVDDCDHWPAIRLHQKHPRY